MNVPALIKRIIKFAKENAIPIVGVLAFISAIITAIVLARPRSDSGDLVSEAEGSVNTTGAKAEAANTEQVVANTEQVSPTAEAVAEKTWKPIEGATIERINRISAKMLEPSNAEVSNIDMVALAYLTDKHFFLRSLRVSLRFDTPVLHDPTAKFVVKVYEAFGRLVAGSTHNAFRVEPIENGTLEFDHGQFTQENHSFNNDTTHHVLVDLDFSQHQNFLVPPNCLITLTAINGDGQVMPISVKYPDRSHISNFGLRMLASVFGAGFRTRITYGFDTLETKKDRRAALKATMPTDPHDRREADVVGGYNFSPPYFGDRVRVGDDESALDRVGFYALSPDVFDGSKTAIESTGPLLEIGLLPVEFK